MIRAEMWGIIRLRAQVLEWEGKGPILLDLQTEKQTKPTMINKRAGEGKWSTSDLLSTSANEPARVAIYVSLSLLSSLLVS